MNHQARSAKAPSLRTGIFAALRGVLGGSKGSGAPSSGVDGTGAPSDRRGVGARTPALRLLAALTLAIALLLALTATPSALAAPPTEFGSQGFAAGQFEYPRGIAIDQQSGDAYVLDSFNARVDKFGPEGEFLLAFGWGVKDGSAELQTCTTASGCQAGVAGAGAGQIGGQTAGIAVDNSAGPTQGDVYVVDGTNHRVQRFAADGSFQLMIGGEVNQAGGDLCLAGEACQAGTEGTGAGEFDVLEGSPVAVGPTGILYVGNRERLQRFSSTGAFESQLVLAPGVGWVRELAVDSSGDLYLVTSEQSGVRKYDAGGTELGEPRDPGAPSFGSALALGPADQLFVADSAAGHVNLYDPAGNQLASFPKPQGGFLGGIAYRNAIERLYALGGGSVSLLAVPAPDVPVVLPGSESATEIQPTTVTLGATINPEGPEPTTYFFEYGTEAGVYGETSPIPPAELTGGPFEDQSVSSAIASLLPRTTYHYRVVAENAIGETDFGPDREFTTLPPVSVDSTSVSFVSSDAATLEAEINPHGLPTTYHFEYDTLPYAVGEAAHGQSTPTGQAGSGNEDLTRAAQIQGLTPGTTYHYRLVAENSLGSVQGPDHAFTTQPPAAAPALPDGRGWLMVSPPDKQGVEPMPLGRLTGGIQSAAGGSAFAFPTEGTITDESSGLSTFSQYLAQESSAAWTVQSINAPFQTPSAQHVGFGVEYLAFSSDLSHSILEHVGPFLPLSPQATEKTPYLRQPDGTLTPLVTAANVPPGTHFGGNEKEGEEEAGVKFAAASPDLSHILLTSLQDLTEPTFSPNGLYSLYQWSAGALSLVSQVPAGSATRCGGAGPACQPAAEAGLELGTEDFARSNRNLISSAGSRAVFETISSSLHTHLWLRDSSRGETLQLDVPDPSCGTCKNNEPPVFQTASADDSRIFFTDTSRLTADSTATSSAADLYLCQVEETPGGLACQLTDLTVDHSPGQHADLQGVVIGASSSGSVVYFVANGALAPGAVEGDCRHGGSPIFTEPAAASCNLYRYDVLSEETTLLAVLSNRDAPDWGGVEGASVGQLTARVSPNGRYLAFMSQRPLTGYDNRDARSGQPDAEVYLYDSQAQAQALRCASCNPTGARPTGIFDATEKADGTQSPLVDKVSIWQEQWLAANLPTWSDVALGESFYQPRYLSDSGRLFFNSADALVSQDSNGTEDVYSYEPPGVGGCTESSPSYGTRSAGCVDLISSGTSSEESVFLDASESGDDAFFLTRSQLAPADFDHALDVYDAHVCTAARPCPPPPPPPPPACEGDACQPPATPPNDPTPGSLTFQGAGNLTECPRGKVKRSGKCVARKHKAKHKKKAHGKKSHRRTAGHNRGGAK